MVKHGFISSYLCQFLLHYLEQVFFAKIGLVILNLFFGYPAVLTWSYFGTMLRKFFNSPKKSAFLNYILGISLMGVAIWIILPH